MGFSADHGGLGAHRSGLYSGSLDLGGPEKRFGHVVVVGDRRRNSGLRSDFLRAAQASGSEPVVGRKLTTRLTPPSASESFIREKIMADTILVVVEQREGKLNRVSWETITAAQEIAAQTGATLEAAVVGSGIGGIAQEVAGKKVSKVYAIESPRLQPYTPDAFAAGLKQFISDKKPKYVLMPHTYQVRDFAPKLATALGRTLISDAVGYKKDGSRRLFRRQMFQGKFAADVACTGEPPYFATFQSGAFRGDKVEAGASAAPVETV